MAKKWIVVLQGEEALVLEHSGKISQTIGHHRDGNYYLKYFEVGFLLLKDRIVITNVDNPFSFCCLLTEKIDLESFISFSNLKDIGCNLLCLSNSSWQLYLPNSNFRRDNPHFTLKIFNGDDQVDDDVFANDKSTIITITEGYTQKYLIARYL